MKPACDAVQLPWILRKVGRLGALPCMRFAVGVCWGVGVVDPT